MYDANNDYREYYLSHAEQRRHKYIDKIKLGDKWRYFYTQQELNAYKNKADRSAAKAKSDQEAYEKARKEQTQRILNKASQDARNTTKQNQEAAAKREANRKQSVQNVLNRASQDARNTTKQNQEAAKRRAERARLIAERERQEREAAEKRKAQANAIAKRRQEAAARKQAAQNSSNFYKNQYKQNVSNASAAKRKIANTESPVQINKVDFNKKTTKNGTSYNVNITNRHNTVGQQYRWVRDKSGKLVKKLVKKAKKTTLSSNYGRPN